MDKLSSLLDNLKQCNKCLKMVESRKILTDPKPIPPNFTSNEINIMLIGIAPGRLANCYKPENPEEKAFNYGTGEVLRRVFSELKIDLKNIYITNVVKCNMPSDNVLEDKDVANCIELYLKKEIDIMQPKIIILLGNAAYNYLYK